MPTANAFVEGNIVTGRVVDVQTSTKFQTGLSKLVSLLIDGEPLQLSRQTTKSTLFVEPVDAYGNANQPGSQRALLFLGDIGGQVARSNLIQARVKRGRGGSLYVTELHNLTTSSAVTPSAQMSPLALIAMTVLVLVCLAALVGAVVGAFLDGSVLRGITSIIGALVGALAPIVALLFIYKLLLFER
jgi:hypothetical protein